MFINFSNLIENSKVYSNEKEKKSSTSYLSNYTYLFLAPSYIENTRFEGGYFNLAVDYLLPLIEKLESSTCSIQENEENIPLNLFNNIKQAYQDALSYLTIKEKKYIGSIEKNKEKLEKNKEKFNLIRKALERSGGFYVPCSWTTESGGHVVVLKIKKLDAETLTLSFLNRGEGMPYHRILVRHEHKILYDYQSTVVSVSSRDFFSSLGEEFLSNLDSLSEIKSTQTDKAALAYGYLDLLGKVHEEEVNIDRAATPQRSGNCPVANSALIFRDLLCESKIKQLVTKKSYFLLKFFALLDHYSIFIQKETPLYEDRVLISFMGRELKIRVKKYQNTILNENEVQKSLEFSNEICNLQKFCSDNLQSDFPSFKLPQSLYILNQHQKPIPKLQPIRLLGKKSPQLTTDKSIKEHVHLLFQKFEDTNQVGEQDFLQLLICMRNISLPLNSFWQSIPCNQAEEFIKQLTILCTKMAKSQFGLFFAEGQIEMFNKACNIANALARLHFKELNFKDYTHLVLFPTKDGSGTNNYKGLNFYNAETLNTLVNRAEPKALFVAGKYGIPIDYKNFLSSDQGIFLKQFINPDLKQIRKLYSEYIESYFSNDYVSFFQMLLLLQNGDKNDLKDNSNIKPIPLFRELTQLAGLAADCVQVVDKPNWKNYEPSYKIKFSDSIESWKYLLERGSKLETTGISFNFKKYNYTREKAVLFTGWKFSCRINQKENALFHPNFTKHSHEWTKDSPLDSDLLKELLKIYFSPHPLQISQACYWAAQQPHLLALQEVRSRLEEIFFSMKNLKSCLEVKKLEKGSSDYIFSKEAIHHFLKTALQFYAQHRHRSEIHCWLACISSSLTKYFSLEDFDNYLNIFESQLLPLLNTQLRQQAARALAYLNFANPIFSTESLLKYMQYFFLFAIDAQRDAIDFPLFALAEKYKGEFFNTLRLLNTETRDRFVNELLHCIHPELTSSTEHWIIENEYLKRGDYAIDFDKQLIYKEGNRIFSFEIGHRRGSWEIFKKIFPKLTRFPATLYGDYALRTDGQYLLKLSGPDFEEVWMKHEERWWKYVQDANSLRMFPPSLQDGEHFFWVSETCEFLITNLCHDPLYQQKGKLLYCLEGEQALVLPINQAWEQFLLPIEQTKSILFKGDREGNLENLAFCRLKLEFKIINQQIISCDYSDFEWQTTTAPYLNGLKRAIYLKNGEEERVILPCCKLEKVNSSTVFFQQPKLLDLLINPSVPYFVYHVDHQHKILVGDSTEAHYYLALMYRGQKDFKRAKKALEKASSMQRPSSFSTKIFNQLLRQQDFSPDATAFDCQWISHFFEQLTNEPLLGPPQIKQAFVNFAYRTYFQYCKFKSDRRAGVFVFSKYLVLSSSQEEQFQSFKTNYPQNAFGGSLDKLVQESEKHPIEMQDLFFKSENYLDIQKYLTNPSESSQRIGLMRLKKLFESKGKKTRDSEKIALFCTQQFIKTPLKFLNIKQPVPPLPNLSEPLPPPPSVLIDHLFHIDIPRKQFEAMIDVEKALSCFDISFTPLVDLKELPLHDSTDPIEQKIIEQLREGHLLNVKKKEMHCELKSDLTTLKKSLQTNGDNLRNKVENLEKELLQRLKSFPQQADPIEINYISQSWKDGTLLDPEISDLIELILSRDPSQLLNKNPLLDKDTIDTILSIFFEFLSYSVSLKQVENILKEEIGNEERLDTFTVQSIGERLTQKRNYKICEYPEFLLFEWASGMILRPEQTEILLTIFEFGDLEDVQQLNVAFRAAGGKTKVMLLLMALIFTRKNNRLLAVEIPSHLYEIAKMDLPQSLGKIFQQRCALLEISIHSLLDQKILENILSQLEKWHANHTVLLLQPQTLDVIEIVLETACSSPTTEELYQAALKIKKFFKEKKALCISDEGHMNASPFTETIKALGELQEIPKELRRLLIRMYRILNGWLEQEFKEGTLSQINEIKKNELLLKFKEELLHDEAFIEIGKNFPLFEYLSSKSQERPSWLQKLYLKDPPLADQIILAKAMCNTFLPHFFSLRSVIDFGPSTRPGDLSAAPKEDAKDLLSQFADSFKTMSLTIQETYRQGITGPQMILILSTLIKKIEHDRKNNLKTTYKVWKTLFETKEPEELDLDDPKQIQAFVDEFGRKPELLEYYLDKHALVLIKKTLQRIKVSPTDRSSWFDKTIFLSATPGLSELYPIAKQQSLVDPGFSALTLATLLRDENRRTIVMDFKIEGFFKRLATKGVFPCALLERGGNFRHTPVERFTQEVLNSGFYDGFLFFEKMPQEKLIYQTKNKRTHLQETNLVPAMRQKGLDWYKEKIFSYYSIDKTTGLDLKQPNQGVFVMTVSGLETDHAAIGEPLTLDEVIQALNRARLILKKGGQTVVLLLDQKLFKEGEFSQETWINGMIKTTARKARQGILLRAIQGIGSIIKGAALREIEEASFQDRSKIYALRKRGLLESAPQSLWDEYEQPTAQEEVTIALGQLFKDCYEKFGYPDDQFLNKKEKQLIDDLIKQTGELLDKIEIGAKNTLTEKMVQNQEQQQNQQKNEKQRLNQNECKNNWNIVNCPTFTTMGGETTFIHTHFSALKNLNLPPLLFHRDFFEIGTYSHQSSEHKLIGKPVMYVGIIFDKPHVRFFALDIRRCRSMLRKNKNPWIICNNKGQFLYQSNHDLKEKFLEIKNELQEILLFIELLSGKIENKNLIVDMLKKREIDNGQFKLIEQWLIDLDVDIDEKNFLSIFKILTPQKKRNSISIEIDPSAVISFDTQDKKTEEKPTIRTLTSDYQLKYHKSPKRTDPNTCLPYILIAFEISVLVLGILALLSTLKLINLGNFGNWLARTKVVGSAAWVAVDTIILIAHISCLVLSSSKRKRLLKIE